MTLPIEDYALIGDCKRQLWWAATARLMLLLTPRQEPPMILLVRPFVRPFIRGRS